MGAGSLLQALLRIIVKGFPALGRSLGSLRLWFMARRWGAGLIFVLSNGIGMIILRALEFVGLSMIAYNFATPALMQYVSGPLLGMPQDWQNFLSMTRIDDAITVIISAMVYALGRKVLVGRSPTSDAGTWVT